jgi:tetratricopeptide (TPR) repeat protein
MFWISAVIVVAGFAGWLFRPKWLRVARKMQAAQRAFQRKEWVRAEQLYREAIVGAELLNESGRSRLLCPCLVDLATICHRGAKLREADELLQKAVALREPGDQFESNSFALAHHALGRIRIDQGRYVEAQHSFERSIHWHESTGNKGMAVVELQNAGDALLLQSEFAQAEKVFLRASDMEREVIHEQLQRNGKIPGASTSISMTQPDIYFSQKRWPDALIAYRQKVSRWQKATDVPEIVDVPRLQMRLAAVLGNLQDFSAAIQIYRNCIEKLATEWPEVHPKAAVCLAKLAGALAADGKRYESKETAEKSLQMFAACSLPDHPEAEICRGLVTV